MADLNKYLKIPYVEYGRDPATGIDCWGMVKLVSEEVFGIGTLPSHEDVSARDKNRFTNVWEEHAPSLFYQVDKPRPGDVLAMYSKKWILHIGICVESDGVLKLLHTNKNCGPKIDKIEVAQRRFLKHAWWRHAGT